MYRLKGWRETSGRNLLAAEAAAGVRHHVALSKVGTGQTPDSGYFRGRKRRQCYGENLPFGTDMRQFPTVGHLLSWAGLIKRLNESAGKRRSTRVRKRAPWLKPVLVQSAWAASRKRNSYFEAQFLRLNVRRGPKKAAVAVAALATRTLAPII
jgi:hypothetical protein